MLLSIALNQGALYFQMLIESALIIFFALLLDAVLGEPKHYHPLVGFGLYAGKLESTFNSFRLNSAGRGRLNGVLALLISIFPAIVFFFFIQSIVKLPQFIDVIFLYLAIGRKSLMQHAQAVITPLENNNLLLAKQKIARIVSRDTDKMQKDDVIKATIETVIENSNDAIFAALFWFLVAGVPGVIIYRLVNTLDAMWGYKNSRFIYFGWAAARLDDALNWLPARLTVLSFALSGKFRKVFTTAFQQGLKCSSKNAGPVMAAGACALAIKLGGDACYQGRKISKPELGYGRSVELNDIKRSMRLVNKTVVLWFSIILMAALLVEVIGA